MTDAGAIFVGYTLIFGGAGLYVVRVLTRGRSLARRVPDEDKPWT